MTISNIDTIEIPRKCIDPECERDKATALKRMAAVEASASRRTAARALKSPAVEPAT
jgi:hypothetical protein